MRLAAIALAIALAGCQDSAPAGGPGAGQMTILEVAAVAEAAGFSCTTTLLSAVAIAIEESSLYPDAVNPHPELGNRPDGSVQIDRGLWQISSYYWSQFPDEQVFDPAGAAEAAFFISDQGTDFSPWAPWVAGTAQKHFDESYNGWPALRPIIEDYCGGSATQAQAAAATVAALPTADIIRNFLTHRAAALTDTGPALGYYLDRFNRNVRNGVSFPSFTPMAFFAIAEGAGQAAFDAFATSPDGNWALWAEGTLARYSEGGPGAHIAGQVATFEAGVDYLIGHRLIAGVMISTDAAREISDDFGYRVGGTGWMAGPYAAIRIGEGILLDAKVLWGRSVNTIQPLLTYTDTFATARFLATVRLGGEAALGSVLFRPELAFVYFREVQGAYVDTDGFTIPEQTVGTARLSFGPEIATRMTTAGNAMLEPTLALQGIWDLGASQLSSQLTGGLRWARENGLSLSLRAGVGGLFTDFRSWSVGASFRAPIN